MPYIRTIEAEDARGELKRAYDAAVKRAGKVFNVVRIQSLHPRSLTASIGLYQTLMLGRGPLDRSVREMLATVVSRAMDCFY